MAKKRKKGRSTKIAGIRISKPMVRATLDLANTALGRVLLAEALVLAAGVLVRKHPEAAEEAIEAGETAVAAVGSGAATATKAVTGSLGDAAAKFMHAAAERLRAGTGLDLKGDAEKSRGNGRKGYRPGSNGSLWDTLDEDTIRQAVLGDFGRKGKRKKLGAGKRH